GAISVIAIRAEFEPRSTIARFSTIFTSALINYFSYKYISFMLPCSAMGDTKKNGAQGKTYFPNSLAFLVYTFSQSS
ncbi:MAG: hypothetical protein MSN52_00070, partial [Limosilactobacillus reuteri]|nr:hypothetical protein [Limosilactobacillus reuteri]